MTTEEMMQRANRLNNLAYDPDEDTVSAFKSSPEIGDLMESLAKAQAEFPPLHKNQTANVRMKAGGSYTFDYADLLETVSKTGPVLAKHGIAVTKTQTYRIILNSVWFFEVIKLAKNDQWIESEYPCGPWEGNHKDHGGSTTYSRRYGLQNVTNTVGDPDMDGFYSEEEKVEVKARKGGEKPPKKPATKRAAPTEKDDMPPDETPTELIARAKRESEQWNNLEDVRAWQRENKHITNQLAKEMRDQLNDLYRARSEKW